MRTVIAVFTLTIAFAAPFIVIGSAAAKGQFSAEVSGGGMAAPVTISGPLTAATVFAYDSAETSRPEKLEPAYTVKLMSIEPVPETGEYPPAITLTYFPGDGDSPAKLRGEWEEADRYFEASPEFESILDRAISASVVEDDDRASPFWYIAPSLALGAVLIGDFAGRRLLMRHD